MFLEKMSANTGRIVLTRKVTFLQKASREWGDDMLWWMFHSQNEEEEKNTYTFSWCQKNLISVPDKCFSFLFFFFCKPKTPKTYNMLQLLTTLTLWAVDLQIGWQTQFEEKMVLWLSLGLLGPRVDPDKVSFPSLIGLIDWWVEINYF